MATVREIARRANVSITTVSRVLNSKQGVGDDVRELVLSVAQDMGYTPAKRVDLASSMVTHLTALVRPLRRSLSVDPFYSDVLRSLEQYLNELGISLSFNTLDISGATLRAVPVSVKDDRLSGAFIIGAIPRSVVESIEAEVQRPIVLVDNDYPDGRWDSVAIDNARGSYLAASHLIGLGHRTIALIGGPDHSSIVERRAGYERALADNGLQPIVVSAGDLTAQDGDAAVRQVLREAPGATAIMCSNDPQAIGAISALTSLGVRVPEEMSVFGFDDDDSAPFASPPLTTVHVDRRTLGQLAGQILLGRVRDSARYPVKAIAGVKVVHRDSVTAPRLHALTITSPSV